MNAQAGLPEVLATRQRRVTVSDDLALGGSRGAHISIRSSRFRLINASGIETLVPNLHLDVVIIRANPKTSKLYYDTWDPNNPQPPVCFSDNGVAPSTNALQPQSPTCGGCAHNQMNSKINPQTGRGSKACKDLKKLAVIIPGDPAVNVYELQVPPDSLSNLKSYSTFLSQQATGGQRKVDIGDMVTRLSFDAEASHPRLKFEPVGWADDSHTLQMIDYIYDQQLDVTAVGLNDVPADPALVKQAIEIRAHYPQQLSLTQKSPLFAQTGVHYQQQSIQEQLSPQSVPTPLGAHHILPYEQGTQKPQPVQTGVQQLAPQISGGAQAFADSAPQQGPSKRAGRPRKQPQEQLASPAPEHTQQFQPVPATPVATPGLPDIPEFLRRPAVNTAPPVPPAQPAQPQPPVPQFGMAAAPPPPPAVAEALQAAMRMPPRR